MNFKITYKIYIILICYAPLMGTFLPKTNFGAGIPDFDAVRLFSYLLILSFSVEFAINKKTKIFNKWISILFLFTIFVLASVIWSRETYSFQFFQEYFDWLFIRLIIAIIGINVFQYIDNIKSFIKHLAISTSILSLIGIKQFILGLTVATGAIRAFGTFGGPNGFAVFLVLAIPIILFGIEHKIMSKKYSLIALGIVITGVFSTVSRKGVVGVFVSLLLYMLLKKQFKKLFIVLFISIFCGLILFNIPFIQQRFERFQKTEIEKQVVSRVAMACAGVKMFLDHPIIGLGFKGYNYNFSKYFPHSWKKHYDAHNEFVTALANYGIIGFTLFLLIFLYPVLYSRNTMKKFKFGQRNLIENDLAIVCIATTLPLMMSFFFAGAMFYVNQFVTPLYYTIIALVFYRESSSLDTLTL